MTDFLACGVSDEGSRGLQPLLTYGEVAKILRVTPKTVYNLVRRGELKATRFGHNVRICAEDLAEFIARSKGGRP